LRQTVGLVVAHKVELEVFLATPHAAAAEVEVTPGEGRGGANGRSNK